MLLYYIADLIGNSNDDTSKRDYIFYLAVGYTKLKVIFLLLCTHRISIHVDFVYIFFM